MGRRVLRPFPGRSLRDVITGADVAVRGPRKEYIFLRFDQILETHSTDKLKHLSKHH